MSMGSVATEFSEKFSTVTQFIISFVVLGGSCYFVIKKYIKWMVGQPTVVLTKAELENLINDSQENKAQSDLLFEERILLSVEAQNLPTRRINNQKVLIKSEMNSVQIFIKDLFLNFVRDMDDIDPTLLYEQNFNNALELVLLEIVQNIYKSL